MVEQGQLPVAALPGRIVSMGYGAISVVVTDPAGNLTMKEMTEAAKDLMESVFKNLREYEKTIVALNKSSPLVGSCPGHATKTSDEVEVEEESGEKPHEDVNRAYGAGGGL